MKNLTAVIAMCAATTASAHDTHIDPDRTWEGVYLGTGMGIGIDATADCSQEGMKCSRQFTEIEDNEDPEQIISIRYLKQTGKITWGGELNYFNDKAYVEGQAGYGFKAFHPYIGLGTDGAAIGIDYRYSNHVIFGVKAIRLNGEPQPQIRMMWQF